MAMMSDPLHDTDMRMIPYIVHEAELMRAEKREKRYLLAVIACVAAIVLSNAAWMIVLAR